MICISIQKKLHLRNRKVSVKEVNESLSQDKDTTSERTFEHSGSEPQGSADV